MPVTAKLSKEFYERFGENIANELVEWFNQVDATYRSDLRELNELNFARFDAKLEQRVAELRSDFDRRLGKLDAKLVRLVSELRSDFDRKLGEVDAKLERLVGELRADFDRKLGGVDVKLGELRTDLAAQKSEMIKWMFVFWTGTVIPLAGLILTLHLL